MGGLLEKALWGVGEHRAWGPVGEVIRIHREPAKKNLESRLPRRAIRGREAAPRRVGDSRPSPLRPSSLAKKLG